MVYNFGERLNALNQIFNYILRDNLQ